MQLLSLASNWEAELIQGCFCAVVAVVSSFLVEESKWQAAP